jgi:DNA-binding beta-propeller fold protein YncE
MRFWIGLAFVVALGFDVSMARAAQPPSGRFVYAVEKDGEIYVYDIASGHRQVAAFLTVDDVKEVRGACASPGSGLLYIAFIADDKSGHVMAVGLLSHKVVWNVTYNQSVDRLACSPDGKRLFVPGNEFSMATSLMILDGMSGQRIGVIHVPARSHDSLGNAAADRIYVETKTTDTVSVIDVPAGKVTSVVGPLAGIVGPFTINADETRLYADVFGLNGFEIADIRTGKSLERVTVPGQTRGEGGPTGYLQNHGIGLTPDGREVWLADGPATGGSRVHIFDVTRSPATEVATLDVEVSCPHWLTFSLKGDYAYIAGPHRSQRENPQGSCVQTEGLPTAVVDVATRKIVAEIAASDGYVMEVDTENGAITGVGSQYGVGRQ